MKKKENKYIPPVEKSFPELARERTRAYHRQKSNWQYPEVSNLSQFLDDWIDQLTQENLSAAHAQCGEYIKSKLCNPHKLTLEFGSMTL